MDTYLLIGAGVLALVTLALGVVAVALWWGRDR